MAQQSVEGGEWDDDDKNYKPPEKRTLEEIRSLDKEDESLQRYKASLLGPALGTFNIPFPDNPLNVVFEKFCILVEGQPDIEFNLLGDLSTLKSKPVQIVEDSRYQIQVVYYVQRDIVCGLRFIQSTHKGFNRGRFFPIISVSLLFLYLFRRQSQMYYLQYISLSGRYFFKSVNLKIELNNQ
ncbi:Rho GDP-dissociation inhibitor 1 isoform 1 [Schistosoma japonicum]|uniref:Rho GDP-dissociation inhibitor 1 isoform 1 n=1 Tax=Schistosoma japonicum TaxID=6182 RepID=A0A4Z2CW54_SCHJA|nr:Rho GDP-dissociation inhibitor 1 isoform 1 [Schistosoma japonicum]